MEPVLSKDEYDTFSNFLEDACGIVLGDNKHYLVTSRLSRLSQEMNYNSLSNMLDDLGKIGNTRLKERIIDAMTTNETSWFRDNYPFEMLKKQILPEHAKKRTGSLRVWSAACSSGQESYSISMTYSEFQQEKPGAISGRFEIVATDISPSVLDMARSGKYDDLSVVRGLSEERRNRFFTKRDDKWELNANIKAPVRFSALNLLQNYVLLGKFDIIFCRNVLIYFSSDLKQDILTRMAQTLNPGGYLFLGGSESPMGYCDAFEMVRFPQGVVYRLKNGWKP